jgi:hypothetical protein
MIHFNSSYPADFGPHRRQIGLGGEIAVARFAKGLGQGFSYDNLGIQSPRNDKAQEFEAGWTVAGAVRVRHVRVKENVTLSGIAAHSPRLAAMSAPRRLPAPPGPSCSIARRHEMIGPCIQYLRTRLTSLP